jgi:hypothetical protein
VIWLILVLLVVLVVLVILLTAWSMFFQSYLYTEPAQGLAWRGPAAAGAIFAVLLVWVVLEYRFQRSEYREGYYFGPIWSSTSTRSPEPFKEMHLVEGGAEKTYVRSKVSGEYHLRGQPDRKLPSAPDADLIVEENGKKYTFKPERDAQGKLLRRENRGGKQELRYVDENRRVMVEGRLGRLETFSFGLFMGDLLLNVLFFAACFLSIWLLVRFQWLHALGHAVVLTLMVWLFALPPILDYAKAVAEKKAATSTTK